MAKSEKKETFGGMNPSDFADQLEIRTGVGDPRSAYYGQLLSEEDEKRLGGDDLPVADKGLWSDVHTDLWLMVGVGHNAPSWDLMPKGMEWCPIPGGKSMIVGTFLGKPNLTKGGYWGACLELPADLGQDAAKRQYITEWITNTLLEAIEMAGLEISGTSEQRLAAFNWAALSSEKVIRAAGL